LDIVKVQETVVTEQLFGGRIEIKAGSEGTVVGDADTDTPLVEFVEYSPEPILAHLEVGTLAKI
jgi:hypothetical protein